jgi:hypothetical protein
MQSKAIDEIYSIKKGARPIIDGPAPVSSDIELEIIFSSCKRY